MVKIFFTSPYFKKKFCACVWWELLQALIPEISFSSVKFGVRNAVGN